MTTEDTMVDVTTDTEDTVQKPCEIAAESRSLEAEMIGLQLSDEGMALFRQKLEAHRVSLLARVALHSASHQLDDGMITKEQFEEIMRRYEQAKEDHAAAEDAEEAYFADIVARIADCEQRFNQAAMYQMANNPLEMLKGLFGGGGNVMVIEIGTDLGLDGDFDDSWPES